MMKGVFDSHEKCENDWCLAVLPGGLKVPTNYLTGWLASMALKLEHFLRHTNMINVSRSQQCQTILTKFCTCLSD